MRELTQIRWHARAGQGAKTASQILALALLRTGRFVQAFPEYGPERRGAPLRAYTRASTSAIRRHDAIEHPDAVVVLEPSLVAEANIVEGLAPDGLVILNADAAPAELRGKAQVVCLPATELGARHGSGFANLTMLGAVASALGEPPIEAVQDAAVDVLGAKVDQAEVRAAVQEGYECLA
jgi:pyruvate ferredoxin oxidoreductase gamma subunit